MIYIADWGCVKRIAHVVLVFLSLTFALAPSSSVAKNVTLAWDPSADPMVAGYKVYCGTASRTYTNLVDAGAGTSATFSNLVSGATYYFAATTYTVAGLESDYSAETPYTVPVSTNSGTINPPTLDPIADVSINQNAGPQTVNLTGISAGAGNSGLSISVNALSGNTGLIPNPTVSYSSPNGTGALTFTTASNSYGSAAMTVMVDDGAVSNNTVIRSFTVTVNQVAGAPAPLTNAIVAPNSTFRYKINPPYANGDRFTYSLGIGAPTGAKVSAAHGVTYLTWTPTTDQSLTTNLISIVINDSTHPNLNTNQTVLVTVLDFLAVQLGSISVPAGQSGLLPVYLSSSSGVTNLSFTVDWPASQFSNPTLLLSAPGIGFNSLQNHQTNLVINLQTTAGQVLRNSNLVAQISFQTLAGMSSAFIAVPVRDILATKPDSSDYVAYMPTAGQVAVVNTKPLLQPASTTDTMRTLTAFGNVGTTYQLQSTPTPTVPSSWSVLTTYTQTNISQILTVDPSNPRVFFRLQAR